MSHKERNILDAFSQGGNTNGKYILSVVQIRAEQLLADHRTHIAVGGCD
jgi:hypothetical protein